MKEIEKIVFVCFGIDLTGRVNHKGREVVSG